MVLGLGKPRTERSLLTVNSDPDLWSGCLGYVQDPGLKTQGPSLCGFSNTPITSRIEPSSSGRAGGSGLGEVTVTITQFQNTVRYPQPPLTHGDRDSFIDLWARQYEDENEHLYTDNIEREKTEPEILALFQWKNGSILSGAKQERVEKEYRPSDEAYKKLTTPTRIWKHVSRDNAVIWNIFWLHCLAPTQFPIYDQHAHRAMMYMLGFPGDLEIPSHPTECAVSYAKLFMPFFEEMAGPNPTIDSARQIDRSLFAFGKFLKSVDVTLWRG